MKPVTTPRRIALYQIAAGITAARDELRSLAKQYMEKLQEISVKEGIQAITRLNRVTESFLALKQSLKEFHIHLDWNIGGPLRFLDNGLVERREILSRPWPVIADYQRSSDQ